MRPKIGPNMSQTAARSCSRKGRGGGKGGKKPGRGVGRPNIAGANGPTVGGRGEINSNTPDPKGSADYKIRKVSKPQSYTLDPKKDTGSAHATIANVREVAIIFYNVASPSAETAVKGG